MSTYQELRGLKVKYLAANPDPATEGDVWYDSVTGELKGFVGRAAWSSGANFLIDRGFVAHTGTQTASLLIGGLDTEDPGFTQVAKVEEYNGIGWTNGGDLPAGAYAGGAAGTQTAGLFFAGANSSDTKQATTFTYNGSAWSATPNSMNTARDQTSGSGTQTSALCAGGRAAPSAAMTTNFEEWNGTAWTALTGLSQKRGYGMAGGPETAYFIAGGATGDNGGAPRTAATEEYNGTSLSSGGNISTARDNGGATGDSSNGLIFGGSIGATPSQLCETYDGSAWTETSDLSSAKRGCGAGAGASSTSAIAAGNYGTPSTNTAEEFNVSFEVVTAGAWAAGGNMNTARGKAGGSAKEGGLQTAGLIFGGQIAPGTTGVVEEYDGSAWTESGDLNTARRWHGGGGSQTAAFCAGGQDGSVGASPVTANSEEYNGSAWTEGENMGTGRYNHGSAGSQTAGLCMGGSPAPSYTNATEEYDGTDWTAGGNMTVSKGYFGGGGTQTAAIVAISTESYEYDGSSWTASNDLPVAASQGSIAGIQTNAIHFGGSPSPVNATQGYDGTNWSTRPSLGTARYAAMGHGTATAALCAGGFAPPVYSVATEEFTGEFATATGSTIDFD